MILNLFKKLEDSPSVRSYDLQPRASHFIFSVSQVWFPANAKAGSNWISAAILLSRVWILPVGMPKLQGNKALS